MCIVIKLTDGSLTILKEARTEALIKAIEEQHPEKKSVTDELLYKIEVVTAPKKGILRKH